MSAAGTASAAMTPRNPDYAADVRAVFASQAFLQHLGAEIVALAPGSCELHLPYRESWSQQHGFFHGGIITTLADNAAGAAAFTMMEKGAYGVTADIKMSFLAPAKGELLIARARVVKPGRSLTVAEADVYVRAADGAERHAATALVSLVGSRLG
ncbi:PaaI family thioesterase [Oceanibacterium hippocampi]|uniref:Medium/long-chain acyl-CoA thioesterase YigI n=1 Tax=Oceanibacterium hippocampi TaxID=745714 RepID=A0A1Y5SLW7_9PROT|nr:PaaI family thioesterase [Oceanibacterium hippocampi]SLN40670.1 Putative esterase [Oceanibacterium hippocampi]